MSRRLIGGAPGGGIWGDVAEPSSMTCSTSWRAGDDLTAGYRMSQETRAAFERARPLLEQALELIEAVQDREERRYAEYCAAHDARKPARPSLRVVTD